MWAAFVSHTAGDDELEEEVVHCAGRYGLTAWVDADHLAPRDDSPTMGQRVKGITGRSYRLLAVVVTKLLGTVGRSRHTSTLWIQVRQKLRRRDVPLEQSPIGPDDSWRSVDTEVLRKAEVLRDWVLARSCGYLFFQHQLA